MMRNRQHARGKLLTEREAQHPGAVCKECQRTVTEAEYSSGVTRCCAADVISEEEAI